MINISRQSGQQIDQHQLATLIKNDQHQPATLTKQLTIISRRSDQKIDQNQLLFNINNKKWQVLSFQQMANVKINNFFDRKLSKLNSLSQLLKSNSHFEVLNRGFAMTSSIGFYNLIVMIYPLQNSPGQGAWSVLAAT